MHRMGAESDSPGERLAKLARRQHGVVSRRQLEGLGIGRGSVVRRIENGQLHRLHRGIYAVGHANLSREGRWISAVLASGSGAVLSHRSAAELWRLVDPGDGPVHVSVQSTAGRKPRRGIRLHRGVRLAPASITQRRLIPVTTPARTLADLRGTVSNARHRRAVRQAEVLGLRIGLVASEGTRSELEDLFLRLCRRHRLPKPEVNARAGPFEVDFFWRSARLIVETDGYRYHRGSQAFEDDHERDLVLRAAEFDVLRFTFRQIADEPERVAALVARELNRSRTNGPFPLQPPART